MKSAEIKLLTHFEDFFSSNMYLLFIKDQNFSEYETNIIS